MVNVALIGACIFANSGGWILGYLSVAKDNTWYKSLKKPRWTPPSWVYGPVWTFLYTSIGYSSYLVYTEGGGFNGAAKIPLTLYGIQLFLNWIWTPIFFIYHKLGLALFELLLILANALLTTYYFWTISNLAALIMIPYLTWLSLASTINVKIYMNNPIKKKDS